LVDNSVISSAVFPLIEFVLPGQKFISTLLSDILTILGSRIIKIKNYIVNILPAVALFVSPG
jgi:hypothetical protein